MFEKLKKLVGYGDGAADVKLSPESPWIEPPIVPPADTVKVSDQTFHRPTAKVYGVRRGMWVYAPNFGVGILTNVYEGGSGTVMLTDDAGFNKVAVAVTLMGVRQARLAEIPASRRPDASVALNLGYS